jgi:hypothetical protein
MTRARTLAAVLATLSLALGACDAAEPTIEPSSLAPAATTDPAAATLQQLQGPWRPVPIAFDDENLLDAMAFVCANPADPDLKAAMEGVPIVLADARGNDLVSVIIADEQVAFECRLKLEMIGGTLGATILDAPSRLDPTAIGPVEDAAVSVVSHTRVDEATGSRTILIGRVGPKAYRVVPGFDDESEVTASKANGWFYAWWPGTVGLGGIASVDSKSLVQSSVPSPATQIEGRVGPAMWWVDPERPKPGPDATAIQALVRERLCAGGRSPEERLIDPTVFASEDAVIVSLWIRQAPHQEVCPENPAFPLEITLPDPLGARRLLDGSEVPPRDATTAVP